MKKLVYGVATPRSLNDINKKYIRDFYADGVEKGTITQQQLNEWITIVKAANEKNPDEPVTAFSEYRREFAKLHYPHLIPVEDMDDDVYYEALLSKFKKPETTKE